MKRAGMMRSPAYRIQRLSISATIHETRSAPYAGAFLCSLEGQWSLCYRWIRQQSSPPFGRPLPRSTKAFHLLDRIVGDVSGEYRYSEVLMTSIHQLLENKGTEVWLTSPMHRFTRHCSFLPKRTSGHCWYFGTGNLLGLFLNETTPVRWLCMERHP